MTFPWFVALRHLSARVRSTLLILLGVSLGVFVLTVMQSMMFGFQRQILDTLLTVVPGVLVKGRERGYVDEGRVLQGGPDRAYAQTRLKPVKKEKGLRNYRALTERIGSLPGVVAVVPWVQGRGLLRFGTRNRAVSVIGVEAPAYDRVVEFRSKVTGSVEEFTQRRDGIILGYFLAEELGAVIGSRVRMEGAEGRALNLRVAGIFRSGITVVDQTQSFLNLRAAQSLFDLPGAVSGFALKTTSTDQSPNVARAVEFGTGLECQSWQEANANFFNIMRQQNSTTFGAVILTVLVAGFGIANGLITAVLEKRRDIGILRALGVTARGIATIFVIEGVVIGLLGTLVGLGLGAWVIDIMSHTRTGGRGGFSSSDRFMMLRGPEVYLTSTVFALAISLVASLFPAFRAAKYDPVEIIRTAK